MWPDRIPALVIVDTGNDHITEIVLGENQTANRTLTLLLGDANRSVTLSGNPTLGDWFNQAVKSTSSPVFEKLTTKRYNAGVSGQSVRVGSQATCLVDLAGSDGDVCIPVQDGHSRTAFTWNREPATNKYLVSSENAGALKIHPNADSISYASSSTDTWFALAWATGGTAGNAITWTSHFEISSGGNIRIANGSLSVGTDALPTGGGSPVLLLTDASSNPTGMAANTAGLVNKAGECYAWDSSGNVTLISPHATKAPAILYDQGPGLDAISRSDQTYTGQIVWTAVDRQARLTSMDSSAKDSLPDRSKVCQVIETFDEYNRRLGLSPGDPDYAQVADWSAIQDQMAAESSEAREAWFNELRADVERQSKRPSWMIARSGDAPKEPEKFIRRQRPWSQ